MRRDLPLAYGPKAAGFGRDVRRRASPARLPISDRRFVQRLGLGLSGLERPCGITAEFTTEARRARRGVRQSEKGQPTRLITIQYETTKSQFVFRAASEWELQREDKA